MCASERAPHFAWIEACDVADAFCSALMDTRLISTSARPARTATMMDMMIAKAKDGFLLALCAKGLATFVSTAHWKRAEGSRD